MHSTSARCVSWVRAIQSAAEPNVRSWLYGESLSKQATMQSRKHILRNRHNYYDSPLVDLVILPSQLNLLNG